jgi:signal transduction histidine kinase
MIVHDLRTPVGVILAFLDIIKDQAATKLDLDDIHFVHFIEIVRRNAETLNDMITTLLDVNRLEAGEMPLHLENCNLCELVESATAATRALVGERRLSLDLPSTPVTVPCDPAIILRVINNLVSNALKFTPQGGKVRVAVDREQTLARVSVGDDGPGIPKEFYGRIFEKFGQLEGDRQIHSTGLGLTFCKLAVETHRGTISVESEPNKGSIFSFTLPLDRRTPDALLATMLE